MQNIKELRDSLSENYDMMKNKEMDLKVGKELANTAGKIISSLKIELEYYSMMGIKKDIDYLNSDMLSK